jgi:hypothetical protein
MDILTFISQVVHSLAWPIVVVIFIWIIRIPIRNLISKFKDIKLEYKDVELKIQLQTDLVELKSKVGVEDNELVKEKIDAMLKKLEDNSKVYSNCILRGYDKGIEN